MANASSSSGTASSLDHFKYKDFKEKKVLGEGSFNQVYLATHSKLGKCVIKVVARSFLAKAKQKQKLEEEARTMFQVKHKHIITGLGVVMEAEHLCLVYEFAEYGSLANALHRINLPWSLKIRIAYETSLAVAHLHSVPDLNIVHNNLKSSNVLLTKDFTVKISDFLIPKHISWITKATQEKDMTDRRKKADGKGKVQPGTLLAHIPPETVRNINTKLRPSYDAYSFAVILWEMLTNKVPFVGKTTEEVFKDMREGYLLPYSDILSDRPDVMFDIMNHSFNHQPEDRLQFTEISERLRPHHERTVEDAKAAVVDCIQAYEAYKVKKRQQIQERGQRGSTSSATAVLEQPSTSSVPAPSLITGNNGRTFDDQTVPPGKEQPLPSQIQAEEMIPQIVDSFAHVAALKPLSRPEQKSSSSTMSWEDTGAFVEKASEDVEEDEAMDADPRPSTSTVEQMETDSRRSKGTDKPPQSSSTIHEPARSYSHPGGDPDPKATPFIPQDDPRYRRQHSQRIEVDMIPVPHSTHVYVQGDSINLQLLQQGDQARSAGNPLSPDPTEQYPHLNRIRALNSTRSVALSDYQTLSRHVGNRWRYLGRSMGIVDGELDAISHDYDREGLGEKIYQTVRRWCGKHGGHPTVGALVDALVESRLHNVASLLEP